MQKTRAPYVTVFTPTYNRASYLNLLYESLCKQDFDDFEWIIVDDGSTDNTRETVDRFVADGEIVVHYHYQENAGKHIAINKGVQLAKGELFFITDSDDKLTVDALLTIVQQWQAVLELPNAAKFAGVCGLRVHQDGRTIGGEVDYQILDTSILDFRYRLRYRGDKAEVLRTDVMKRYPFPEIVGEPFCPEALIWNRIGMRYLMRFFNSAIYVCEYLMGGLSDRSFLLRKASPNYFLMYYAELANVPGIPKIQQLKSVVNFWRFSVYDNHNRLKDKLRQIGKFWAIFVWPLGYAYRIWDWWVYLRKNNT